MLADNLGEIATSSASEWWAQLRPWLETKQGRLVAALAVLAAVAALVFFAKALLLGIARGVWGLVRWLVGLTFMPPTSPWWPTWTRGTGTVPDSHLAQPRGDFPRTAWGKRPGWMKMLVRWLGLAAAYLLLFQTWVVVALGALAVVALAAIFLPRVFRWVVYARYVHDWVEPVARALDRDPKEWHTWVSMPSVRWQWTPPLVVPAGARWPLTLFAHPVVARALRYARLPYPSPALAMEDEDSRLTVSYPRTMTVDDATRELVKRAMEPRLKGGTWELEWDDKERKAVLSHPPKLPNEVWYDPIECGEFDRFTYPVGQGKRGEWQTVPLATKAPHGYISAPTGYAKSSTLNVRIAHSVRWGSYVLICDPKVRSFNYLSGIPGVLIARNVETQAAFYDAFFKEMLWRYELMDGRYPELDVEDPEDVNKFFAVWELIIDEKPTLTKRFHTWWKNQDLKGEPLPLQQEQEILNLARAVNMFVTEAGQQANAIALTDTERRDNHLWRIASGPQSPQSWMMLFPGAKRIKLGSKKGRAVLGIGQEDLNKIQLARTSRETVKEMAWEGVEVRKKEEAERLRRLMEVTGLSLEGLSRPVPNVPGAAGIWPEVPVQGSGTGTAALTSENTSEMETIELWETVEESGRRVLELLPGPTGRTPAEVPNQRSSEGVEEASDADEWVEKVDGAAEFLGLNMETFKRRRFRYKERTGCDIPGTETVNGRVRFKRSELLEWNETQATRVPSREAS